MDPLKEPQTLWEVQSPGAQCRIVGQLVRRVDGVKDSSALELSDQLLWMTEFWG